LPCKSRRQKSRRLPVGTKMTVRTTIRAIGDNLVAIAGGPEFSQARKKSALSLRANAPVQQPRKAVRWNDGLGGNELLLLGCRKAGQVAKPGQ